MEMKKVIATIRHAGEEEIITIYNNYDEVCGIYDYTQEILISKSTYEKLCTGDYFAKRYGSTLRAYQN